jgi:hypothetical protein
MSIGQFAGLRIRKPIDHDAGGTMSGDGDAQEGPLERLGALVGEWDVEAVFPDTGPASIAGQVLSGRAVFEWTLDGQFLLERSQMSDPVPDSTAVMGADPDPEGYTQHYFDARGVTRLYAMTLDDSLWTLQRDKPDFTPLKFAQRYTGRLGDDGATISGRWEKRDPGADWALDFELNYRRVS